jgi:copper(I)-binding protein
MTIRLLTTAAIAFCMGTNAMANDYKAGSIEISTPWSRATPKGAQTAIGYMTIKNNGTTPDRLIGGSVEVADRFQLHAMTMKDGIAKMRDLSGIDIKPGQTIEFKPGGSHAMFVNLKHPLSKVSISKARSSSSRRARYKSNTPWKQLVLKRAQTT